MAMLNGIKCGLDYSSTPMCLLTWYAPHATMRKSIEHLLELKYLICINDNIVISKVGEGVLEEKGLSHFFCNNKEETIDKNQLSIDEPYVPINFKM